MRTAIDVTLGTNMRQLPPTTNILIWFSKYSIRAT